MADLLTLAIMVFNLLISFWNAYAAGYNSVLLEHVKKMRFRDFFMISNSFAVVLSFAGASYALAYFISLIASRLGYISPEVYVLIGAYSFLVFGGLMTFSGIVIAVESILLAYLKRSFVSIAISIYNVIASIWNVYNYVTSFSYATQIAKDYGSNEDDKRKALILVVIAAVIAVFIVYTFYKLGKEKAQRELVRR